MNLNITERIKSASLAQGVIDLLTKVYEAKYSEVHEFASAMDRVSKGEELGVSGSIQSLVDKACALSQGDMLVTIKFMTELAEECGISVTAAAPQAGQQDSGDADAEPVEKTSFQVKITNVDGMEKINAVKYLKELLGVDLKTASGLLDPKELKVLPKTFNKNEADDVVDKLASYKVFTEKV